MKLAIMQPYFFPYLGYFSLIKHSDRFILLDAVQFIRQGWIERNRILKPGKGWQYIRVPLVKHSHGMTIKEVKICSTEAWKDRILRQLEHYKTRAPCYKGVISFLQNAFLYKTDHIADLNAHLLAETCRYIGIQFGGEVFSEMSLDIETPTAADEWALNICKLLNVDTYINPPGGTKFFDCSKYAQAGIALQFLNVNLRPYNQGREFFEEGLSILDIMMFNKPQEIQAMLDDCHVL